MTSSDKDRNQRRMTNLLLAGNLAANYKSSKNLKEMKDVQEKQLEINKIRNLELSKQNRLQEQQVKNQKQEIYLKQKLLDQSDQRFAMEKAKIEKEELEKNKIKLLREVFFNLNEELESTKKLKKSNLEKYFTLMSIVANLEKHSISSKITDDLKEKKIIKNFITDLDNYVKKIWKSLTKVEKEDYIQILKILEIDEEEKIKKIKNSKDYKNYLELENNVKEINESTNLFLLVKDNKDKILSLK
jgi:hypothetical protein